MDEGKRIPSCEVSIAWMKDEPPTKQKFHYRVDLVGAKGLKFLTIQSDPADAQYIHNGGKRLECYTCVYCVWALTLVFSLQQ